MKSSKAREKVLEWLRQIPIVQIASERAGVGRATFYRWKKQNPEFSQAADKAMKEGESLINDLSESQIISLIKDRRLPAIRLWLNHHHERYGMKLDDKPRSRIRPELTIEQKTLLTQVLKLAKRSTPKSNEKNNGKSEMEKAIDRAYGGSDS